MSSEAEQGHNIPFNEPLNWMTSIHGMRNRGWRMEGVYDTQTDARGDSILSIEGKLISPNPLDLN